MRRPPQQFFFHIVDNVAVKLMIVQLSWIIFLIIWDDDNHIILCKSKNNIRKIFSFFLLQVGMVWSGPTIQAALLHNNGHVVPGNSSGLVKLSPDANVNGTTTFESYSSFTVAGCSSWQPVNHILFQLANAALGIGLMAPDGTYGVLFLHSTFLLGKWLTFFFHHYSSFYFRVRKLSNLITNRKISQLMMIKDFLQR